MRVRLAALALLLALALLAIGEPALPLTRTASGTHYGIVECAGLGRPVSDGAVGPGEYDETYFDSTTKILVYFTCEPSAARLLHVAIVAPAGGWVGLQVQARDVWDGTLNEVRMSRAPSSESIQVEDGFRNVTLGTFASDVSLGGSVDVLNATIGASGAAVVYEFCIPLQSPDAADSQLASDGPFYFGLADNPYDPNLDSEVMTSSQLQTFVLEAQLSIGEWTRVELSMAPAEPATDARILAVLRDPAGYPLPGRTVEAFVQTTFGFLDIGPATTNEQGVAQFAYAPRDAGTFVVGAAYEGGGGFLGSVGWEPLVIGPAPAGGEVDLGLFDPANGLALRPIQAIVVAVVGGVWATYAYAMFVIRQTLRPKGPKGGVPETPPEVGGWTR